MKKHCLSLLVLSALSLSGCGYELVRTTHKSGEIYIQHLPPPDVTLTDVRRAYSDGSVEIYDINKPPSAYAPARVGPVTQQIKPPLNKEILVQDSSVEIYDVGLMSPQESQMAPVTSLSPPSDTREAYHSPFQVIKDEPLLTDPFSEEEKQISVIVPPPRQQPEDEEFQLMTGF